MELTIIATTGFTSALVRKDVDCGRKKDHRHRISFSLRKNSRTRYNSVGFPPIGFTTKQDADNFLLDNSMNPYFSFGGYTFVQKWFYE